MNNRFTIQDIARSAVGSINQQAFKEKKQYDFLIGIDCGVNTGFAVYSKIDKKIVEIDSYKIHYALTRITYWSKFSILVRVEDARLRTWIPQQKNEKAERGRREGAGSVKRDATIWQDFLEDSGIDFEMVAPKHNKTKIGADYFKKVTGYTSQTNQHARDAAMLVYGF